MNHCNFNLSHSLEALLQPCGDVEDFLLFNEWMKCTVLKAVFGDSSELVEEVLQSIELVSMLNLYTWILSITNIFFMFVNRALHRH